MTVEIIGELHATFGTAPAEKIRVSAPYMWGSGFKRVDVDGVSWVFAAPGWWACNNIKPDMNISRPACDPHPRMEEAVSVFWRYVEPNGPPPTDIAGAFIDATKRAEKERLSVASGEISMF